MLGKFWCAFSLLCQTPRDETRGSPATECRPMFFRCTAFGAKQLDIRKETLLPKVFHVDSTITDSETGSLVSADNVFIKSSSPIIYYLARPKFQ